MIRRPPRSTRTYTRLPYTTLFRSYGEGPQGLPVWGACWEPMASWPSSRIRALLGRLVGAAQVLGAVQKRDVRERLREISHLPARGGVIFLREQPHIVPQRQRSEERRVGTAGVSTGMSRW